MSDNEEVKVCLFRLPDFKRVWGDGGAGTEGGGGCVEYVACKLQYLGDGFYEECMGEVLCPIMKK